jgi:hypothetical protein
MMEREKQRAALSRKEKTARKGMHLAAGGEEMGCIT